MRRWYCVSCGARKLHSNQRSSPARVDLQFASELANSVAHLQQPNSAFCRPALQSLQDFRIHSAAVVRNFERHRQGFKSKPQARGVRLGMPLNVGEALLRDSEQRYLGVAVQPFRCFRKVKFQREPCSVGKRLAVRPQGFGEPSSSNSGGCSMCDTDRTSSMQAPTS